MHRTTNDIYKERTDGAESIEFGEKPGIAVADFQLGFTHPEHTSEGASVKRSPHPLQRILPSAENAIKQRYHHYLPDTFILEREQFCAEKNPRSR